MAGSQDGQAEESGHFHVPIPQLTPLIANPSSRSIKGVVTLVWPYSSSTRTVALLIAEPDFRLRRMRGQVRTQFTGPIAKAIAKSGIGSGDEVILGLEGAEFVQVAENTVGTPGRGVDFELKYTHRVVLKVTRDSKTLTDLDLETSSASPEVDVTSFRSSSPLEHEGSILKDTPKKSFTRGETQWQSPSFGVLPVDRFNLSLRSAYDPFAEDDGFVSGKGRKRTRFSRKSGEWTYTDRTPSPETDQIDDESLDEAHVDVENIPSPIKAGRSETGHEVFPEREDLSPTSQKKNFGSSVEPHSSSPLQSSELLPLAPPICLPPTLENSSLFQFDGSGIHSNGQDNPAVLLKDVNVPLGLTQQSPDAIMAPMNGDMAAQTGNFDMFSSHHQQAIMQEFEISNELAPLEDHSGDHHYFNIDENWELIQVAGDAQRHMDDSQGLSYQQSTGNQSNAFTEQVHMDTERQATANDDTREKKSTLNLEEEEKNYDEIVSESGVALDAHPSSDTGHIESANDESHGEEEEEVDKEGEGEGEVEEGDQSEMSYDSLDEEAESESESESESGEEEEVDLIKPGIAEVIEISSDESGSESDIGERSEINEQSPSPIRDKIEGDLERQATFDPSTSGMSLEGDREGNERSHFDSQNTIEPKAGSLGRQLMTPEQSQLLVPTEDPSTSSILTPNLIAQRSSELLQQLTPVDSQSFAHSIPADNVIITPSKDNSKTKVQHNRSPSYRKRGGRDKESVPYDEEDHSTTMDIQKTFDPIDQNGHEVLKRKDRGTRVTRNAGMIQSKTDGIEITPSENEAEQQPTATAGTEDRAEGKQSNETFPTVNTTGSKQDESIQGPVSLKKPQSEPTTPPKQISKRLVPQISPVALAASNRGLETSHSNFVSLKYLDSHFNSTIDVLGIVSSVVTESRQAGRGPKDYFVLFRITSPALSASSAIKDVGVEIYRPYKKALPLITRGDGVLLRDLQVQGKHNHVVLKSSSVSAWVVFKRNGEEDTRGPPVEYGDEEREHVKELIYWWECVDGRVKEKLKSKEEMNMDVSAEGKNENSNTPVKGKDEKNRNTSGKGKENVSAVPARQTRSSVKAIGGLEAASIKAEE